MGKGKPLPAESVLESAKAVLVSERGDDHWHRYRCTLVTPMYGGGVDAGKVDEDMPIRATAIRGQLRIFWWRIAHSQQFIKRSLSQTDQIAHASGTASPIPKTEHKHLFKTAALVKRSTTTSRWRNSVRRFGWTNQQMSFGSLLGSAHYVGSISETFPWLAAGQWLQIGSKTAFGFGRYALANGAG